MITDLLKFTKLKEITITYMETTPPEQKDKDSAVQGTGSFEGYKPRSENELEISILHKCVNTFTELISHRKLQGTTNPVEEYNFDYKNAGSITRPMIFQESECTIRTVLDVRGIK
jgi:hypothetical protein